MKYHVVIHYEGAWAYDIDANDEDEAAEKAEAQFCELDYESVVKNLCDASVCDCWPVTEEDK